MSSKFVLDTNAYALLFQSPKPAAYHRLEPNISAGEELKFFLPEIVSMEIHSVVGKYRRGGVKGGREQCVRQIVNGDTVIACGNTCFNPQRKRMSKGVFKALQKLMDDIECGHGPIKAEMIPLGPNEIAAGKLLLARHAGTLAFGSHDSLVAGTVQVARNAGRDLTLVTSDKGLKAVCTQIGIPVFDPNIA